MGISRHKISVVILLLSALLSATALYAETVSQKQAKEYAQKFFDTYYGESVAPVKMVYTGKRLTTNRLFTPFYVYNEPRGGYVIISAENKVFPVLGFNLTDNFDEGILSDGEKELLRNYALDIEEIRYDSNVPERAILAWQDYEDYITHLLRADEHISETPLSRAEAEERLVNLWTTEAGLNSYADLYTPEQWQAMVDEELGKSGSVAVGYIFGDRLFPAVISGKKGDYYRINTDKNSTSFMRLMAGEISGDRQLLATDSPAYKSPEIEEEAPFAFYDEFVRSVENEKRQEAERRIEIENKPVIKDIGGGHFDVLLPEDITLALLYNVGGNHIGRRTYKGTNMANINIESEPNGFYFALIIGESGKPYGIKLYR